MSDTTTVTTTKSWGSRIKSALAGIIVGPLLIIGGSVLLWTNEGNNARMIAGMNEGRKSVVEIQTNSIDPTNEWKLVHLVGDATTSDILRDPAVGLSVTGIVLDRHVEMYQWEEKKHTESHDNVGWSETTTTTYTYSKVWDSDKHNSSSFNTTTGHENPKDWKYESQIWYATQVNIDQFNLTSELISKIDSTTPINLASQGVMTQSGEIISGNTLYVGANQNSPAIGDLRVSYKVAESPLKLSILAKQTQKSLSTYIASSDADITRVSAGNRSAQEMFADMESENTLMTWIFRGVWFFLIFIGFSMFLSILPILAMFLPFLGYVVNFGVSLLAFLATIVLGGGVVITAWFVYRPLFALLILTIVGIIAWGIIYVLRMKHRENTQIPTSTDAPTASTPSLPPTQP